MVHDARNVAGDHKHDGFIVPPNCMTIGASKYLQMRRPRMDQMRATRLPTCHICLTMPVQIGTKVNRAVVADVLREVNKRRMLQRSREKINHCTSLEVLLSSQ